MSGLLEAALVSRPGLARLPVLEALPRLAQQLSTRDSSLCALEAPPGSGKTLLAPLWLSERMGYRRVLVLVPRRVNARLPWLFLEEACGPRVGYRIRFESRWDEQRIKVGYLTYGTALRSFVDEPPAPGDLVIFDEFHERPWEADLLLAFLRAQSQVEGGPRLLLMSATLDHDGLPCASQSVVRSDGLLHSVTISREKDDPMILARPQGIPQLIARRSAELAREQPGEQLIFLPGISTIRAVEAVLRSDSLEGEIDILHSSLGEAEIRRVVERTPGRGFRRILSTDLAESSVTLPGVSTVLDSGLQRRPRRDPFGLGITLDTVRAPLASLSQRAGRAGRLGPGRCHRLFSQVDELHRPEFGRPEILEIDGKSLVLHLASLQLLSRWRQLAWLAAPDEETVEEATAWLQQHGLLNSSTRALNERGQRVLRSACSPRAGLFGLLASESGWPALRVADWVYAMDTGPGNDGGADCRTLSDLAGDRTYSRERDGRLLSRLRETFAGGAVTGGAAEPSTLLLKAFADTLIELRGERALPRLPGAEALLYRSGQSPPKGYAVLLATAPVGGAGPASRVSLYEPVATERLWEELLDSLLEVTALEWDAASRRVKAVRRTTLGALTLEEETVKPEPGAEVAEMLLRHLTPADYGEEFAAAARRLRLFFEARPQAAAELLLRLPVIPDGDVVDTMVRSFLYTVTGWNKGSGQALYEHVRTSLGYSTCKALEAALPSSVLLPGRLRPVPVHYPSQGSPYVASKLQDFFGWSPPRLLEGQLRLACHLLAPSGRPVQITEDLDGFWRGSYAQVRKDLRGRYPKHSWPEKPPS